MRAAVLTATRHIELQDVPVPRPGPGEVLIRVRVAGICGSELHAFNGTHPFRKPPALQGHEMAGDVAELGEGVQGIEVGDRVTLFPPQVCGRCPACMSGQPNLCENKLMPGTPQWPGCFADYMTAPAKNLFKLPSHISYEEGAITEPLAVGVHAVRQAGLTLGKSVAVMGAGTIGMACIAAAREAGAWPIVAVDVADFNVAAARKFGASVAVNPLREDAVSTIRQATGGRGVDVAIVAAGYSSVLNQALASVRPKGEIVAVALFDGKVAVDDPFFFIGGERVLKSSWIYTPQEFQMALDLITSGRVSARAFITQRLPLEQTQRGLEILAEKKEDCIKVLLQIG